MKFLETLNTSPHKHFPDISDDWLIEYAEEVFEIFIADPNPIKNIINVYSHMLFDDSSYSYDLILPSDLDIVNAAVSVYIKYTSVDTVSKQRVASFIDLYEHEFALDILNLKLTAVEYVENVSALKSVAQAARVPTVYKVLPTFKHNLVTRRLKVRQLEETKVDKGCLYIDSSASMLYNTKLFSIILSNVNFIGSLHVYSIDYMGIRYRGIATNIAELKQLVSSIPLVSGEISYELVLKHSKSHSMLSTFVTDSDDFTANEFKLQTNKFNLITINNGGEIIKIK